METTKGVRGGGVVSRVEKVKCLQDNAVLGGNVVGKGWLSKKDPMIRGKERGV